MKKNKTMETPKQEAAQQLAESIRSYYTKEINDKIEEMSAKTMGAILKDFPDTDYWIAMLKYIGLRQLHLDSMLRISNPYTQQHNISWAQGAMSGLSDVPSYVIELNSTDDPADKEEDPAGVII